MVVKRKASGSLSSDNKIYNENKKRNSSVNPFLPALGRQENALWKERSVLFEHAIAFDELAKSKTITADCITHVAAMMDLLQSHQGEDSAFVEVIPLILPWAIRHVLSNNNDTDKICWKALSVCLVLVSSKNDPKVNQTLSQSALSQSNLHKLVPCLVTTASYLSDASSTKDVSSETIPGLAEQSIQILLSKYYRPSLEVACRSILLLVVQQDVPCDSVTLLILQWIASMLHSANPKTTFQLFSSLPILLAFARLYFGSIQTQDASDSLCQADATAGETPLQVTVRHVLSVGLFDAQHMEGFASLLSTVHTVNDAEEKQNTFQCYQQTLLTTITVTLSGERLLSADEESSVVDLNYLALLIPVLLRTFFTESNKWEQEKTSKGAKKKPATKERLAHHQFRMFKQLVESLVHFLGKALEDVDPERALVAFSAIRMSLSSLQEFEVHLPSQDDGESTQFKFLDKLGEQLLRFGGVADTHRLGSDARTPLLAALQSLMSVDHRVISSRLVDLMTFALQYDDKVGSYAVVKLLRTVVDTYRMLRQQSVFFEAIVTLLKTGDLQQPMESASLLNACLQHPLLTQSLAHAIELCPFGQLETIFKFVGDELRQALQKADENDERLAVLVTIMVLVMKHVRVGRDNASVVAAMCGALDVESYHIPVQRDSSDSMSRRNAALALCAWCIHLNGRSSFWTGRSSELRIPQWVRKESLSLSVVGEGDADEVLLLLGHRLRELHSLIYESERPEIQDGCSRSNSMRDSLVDEATTIAALVADIAAPTSTVAACPSRWAFVGRNFFASWIPYATQSHVDSFLNWLFLTASMNGLSEMPETFLCDTTFYENPLLVSRMGLAALGVARHWIQDGMSLLSRSPLTEAADRHVESLDASFRCAVVPVQVVNGIFRTLDGSRIRICNADALNLAWSLDELVFPLLVDDGTTSETACLVCGALRELLANGMSYLSHDDIPALFGETSVMAALLRVSALPSKGAASIALLSGSASLTAQIIRLLSASPEGVLREAISDMSLHSTAASIGRSVLKGVSDCPTADTPLLALILGRLWNGILPSVHKDLESVGVDEPTDSIPADTLYLFGDLLRFSKAHGLCESWSSPDLKTSLEDGCIDNISDGASAAVQYVVACIAKTSPSLNTGKRILGRIVMSSASSPLLDAVFCQLLVASKDGLLEALKKLMDRSVGRMGQAANQIRLLEFCLNRVDHEGSVLILKDYAPRIFSVTLPHLSRRPAHLDTALAACSLLEHLLSSSRVFICRDTDLTRLLSSITAAVGHTGGRSIDGMAALPNELYSAYTELFLTLFHRYTKHLYACVPLVLLATKAFLCRVLYEPDLSDAHILDRAQRFSRVCEQFVGHKEIYKKHLLGVILEFIHAVENKLSLVRKKALVAAVYLLIDSLSSHELKQLNAVMDSSSTIVFKGIYQDYQKMHAFKGQ